MAIAEATFPRVVDRSGGRLLKNANHVEAGELAGAPRGFDLRCVEVRRHRDHRAGDRQLERVGAALEGLAPEHLLHAGT